MVLRAFFEVEFSVTDEHRYLCCGISRTILPHLKKFLYIITQYPKMIKSAKKFLDFICSPNFMPICICQILW